MKPHTKAYWQLHTAVLLAGFTGILGKLIQLNEAWLVWYRMLITTIVLLLMAWKARQTLRLPFAQARRLFFIGFIIAMHWVFFYGSIKYGNVSVALVCFAATSAFTAIVEPLLLKSAFRWQELMLGALVLMGIYLIFHFDASYRTGIVLGTIAAFLSALFPVLNKRVVRQIPAGLLSLYELGGGWIILTLLLPLYLWFSPASDYWPRWADWGWLLILSVFCTVLAFQLSVNALKYISPFTVNLTYNLEPLYGILLAFLLFREDQLMGKGFYLGSAVILFTLLLHTWWQNRIRRSLVKNNDTD